MKTILIVDDEQDVRIIVRMMFSKNPAYRLLEAANGHDALALTKQERPELIILDWLMPGLDGKNFLKTLRGDAELADTPVIMMTVKGELAAQAEGRALGVVAYLVKPFASDTLMEQVQEALKEKC